MFGAEDIRAVDKANIIITNITTGKVNTSTNYITNNNGIAYLTFDEAGKYSISAVKNGGEISRPYCIVNVNDGEETENEKDVLSDKETLQIPELGSSAEVKLKSLTLPNMGDKNSVITWDTSDSSVINLQGKVTRYKEDKTVTLTATIKKGSSIVAKEFVLTVPAMNELGAAIELNNLITVVLNNYRPVPIFGVHKNIIDVVEEKLVELGKDDVTVKIKSSSNEAVIQNDGTINYYKDFTRLNSSSTNNSKVVFTLNLDGVEQDWILDKNINVFWDHDAVLNQMKVKELNKVTWDAIKGANEKQAYVTSDLVLPAEVQDANQSM